MSDRDREKAWNELAWWVAKVVVVFGVAVVLEDLGLLRPWPVKR